MTAASVDRLRKLFEDFGQSDYIGESVSQLEHALQAAALAAESVGEEIPSGVSPSGLISACLLHDIGHLVASSPEFEGVLESMGGCGAGGHERIGAEFLVSLGFRKEVCELVAGHVATKRYLCAEEPGFEDCLSEASRTTLKYQGGPMSEEEAQDFRANPLFSAHLAIRRCDDKAKVPDLEVPPFEHYVPVLQQCLL